MLIKVLLATILTLGIGAASAFASGKKVSATDAYASTISVPTAEDRLFERAKGDVGGS